MALEQQTKTASTANDELVLVTGASGSVACHSIQQLQRAGYRVRGTVRDLKNDKKCQPIRELCVDAKHAVELVEADLTKADTWPAAVAGCDYILALATPNPMEFPKSASKDKIITDNVDGILNVLRAARDVTSVKRVVFTSGLQAIQDGFSGDDGRTYTEDDWFNFDKRGLLPVERAKAEAERAAWRFMREEKPRFELSVLHPGLVLGPALTDGDSTSQMFVGGMLKGDMSLVPRMWNAVIDVRDVAAAHIAAMTSPEAAGKRHILVSDSLWMKDIAQTLRDEFASQGYKISTSQAPYCLIWLASWFSSMAGMILRALNSQPSYDNTRMRTVLHVTPRPVKQTIIETAYSLIERGLVKKTDKYTGPPETSS